MIEYPKIETLFDRDEKFKVVVGKWRTPEFEYLKDNQWFFTEKIDGTNIRVDWNKDDQIVTIGGKTNNAQIPPFLLAKLQALFPVDKMKSLYPDISMTLYGEGYGAKIQKGGGNYIPNGVNFCLFDVFIDGWWLERPSCEEIAGKLEIGIVPIVGQGTIQQAVDLSRSLKSTFGNFQAEGLVIRPLVSLQSRHGHRIMGKIKMRDF